MDVDTTDVESDKVVDSAGIPPSVASFDDIEDDPSAVVVVFSDLVAGASPETLMAGSFRSFSAMLDLSSVLALLVSEMFE